MQYKTTLKCNPLHHTPWFPTINTSFTNIYYIKSSYLQVYKFVIFS
jgi:hypothetical protein